MLLDRFKEQIIINGNTQYSPYVDETFDAKNERCNSVRNAKRDYQVMITDANNVNKKIKACSTEETKKRTLNSTVSLSKARKWTHFHKTKHITKQL